MPNVRASNLPTPPPPNAGSRSASTGSFPNQRPAARHPIGTSVFFGLTEGTVSAIFDNNSPTATNPDLYFYNIRLEDGQLHHSIPERLLIAGVDTVINSDGESNTVSPSVSTVSTILRECGTEDTNEDSSQPFLSQRQHRRQEKPTPTPPQSQEQPPPPPPLAQPRVPPPPPPGYSHPPGMSHGVPTGAPPCAPTGMPPGAPPGVPSGLPTAGPAPPPPIPPFYPTMPSSAPMPQPHHVPPAGQPMPTHPDPIMQYFITQMHQQNLQAQQFQQALLQMQHMQTQMFAQLSTGTTTATAQALQTIGVQRPSPNLAVSPWTPNNNKTEWITLLANRVHSILPCLNKFQQKIDKRQHTCNNRNCKMGEETYTKTMKGKTLVNDLRTTKLTKKSSIGATKTTKRKSSINRLLFIAGFLTCIFSTLSSHYQLVDIFNESFDGAIHNTPIPFKKEEKGQLSSDNSNMIMHKKVRTIEKSELGNLVSGVLIEVRCHEGLLIVLQSTMRKFAPYNMKLFVWHSAYNKKFIQALIDADPFLQECVQKNLLVLHEFNPTKWGFKKGDEKGVQYEGKFWYSRLCKHITFWESMSTEWVITIQMDTWFCQSMDSLLPYLEGDTTYIGGVSNRENYLNKQNPTKNQEVTTHMNGGFSLRSVPWTIKCILSHAHHKQYNDAIEDSAFNYCHKSMKSSTPVTELEALSFSSDNGITKCFTHPETGKRTCPFGVHKPWVTEPASGNYTELSNNCPDIEILKNSQEKFTNKGSCTVRGMESFVKVPCKCWKAHS